jgi:hypothetical protein
VKTNPAEKKLQALIASTAYDPTRFVQIAYPWGEPGVLAKHTGPDAWQRDILDELGESLRQGKSPRISVASGHGIGKSTLVAWVIHWFVSTRPHPQVVVTANTREQLLKKTFRELAVWHKRSINSHWWVWTATKFYHVDHPETWFASAIPWSAENPEAFAGTHAEHVMLIFDEASGIADTIWETAEGAMTTARSAWLCFGNPTKNTGRFRECFGKYKHRWSTRQIDSRTAKMASNKEQIAEWIEDYGEDSDFVRVRVKGEFPRASTTQFIPSHHVERAMVNRAVDDEGGAKLLGVDVARFGDDQSIILKRVGGKVFPLTKFRGIDTMQLAGHVAQAIEDWDPDAVFVDGTGMGAGVVDRLRSLNYKIIEVINKENADDPLKYANKRAETWGRMRDWLKGDVELPDDSGLRDGLIGLEYGFSAKMAIQLEKKEDLKKRGLASPDEADALALTFAELVRGRDSLLILPTQARLSKKRADLDWRVY